MIIKFFYLYLCLNVLNQDVVEASVSVVEVPAGQLAILPCLSSDDFHRFMFWQLTDDRRIIGPGNSLDEEKYNYEVLTGKLFIRRVTAAEAGSYKCISRGVEDNSAINIHIVQLIVLNALQGLQESAFEKNLLLGMSLVMVIVVGIAIAIIIVLRRQRSQAVFEPIEESRENSPEKYIPRVQVDSLNSSPKPGPSTGIDNLSLEVDFPKVYHQMQKGQTIQL